MNYSTNFKLNKPERNEQFNLDDWNNNTDAIDTAIQTNKTNIATQTSNLSTLISNLTANTNRADINSTFYKLFKMIYPVGSLYWSSKSTNPSTLFGGTWTQIKDRFVLACGDTYKTAGATGGASHVTLAVANMPAHTHTFTPAGTITMNAHTHTIGSHTHLFSGTTAGMSKNATGEWGTRVSNSRNGGDGVDRYTPHSSGNITYSDTKVRRLSQRPDDDFFASQEHYFSIDVSHTHTYSGTTGSNQPSCSSVTTTGSFKGTAGTTSSNGSGTSFSIIPPYIVKYCWERTA